jgi:hypothetical protein
MCVMLRLSVYSFTRFIARNLYVPPFAFSSSNIWPLQRNVIILDLSR